MGNGAKTAKTKAIQITFPTTILKSTLSGAF